MTTYSLRFQMKSIHYFYFLSRLLIIFQFIFPTLTIDLRQEEDNALAAFVGGTDQFDQFCKEKLVTIKQSKENLAQIYGIYLGALFYLRRNKTFGLELDDPSKLGQFRENLDILYEYFYNVYAAGGHSSTVVKPKFGGAYKSSYDQSAIMHYMVHIWRVELEIKSNLVRKNDLLHQLIGFLFYLQVINEDELDYLLPRHLIVTPSKDQQTDEANEPTRTKFDGIMEKIYKKAEKKLIEGHAYNYGMEIAIQDEAFVAFVKRNNDHLSHIVQMYGQREGSYNEFNSDKFEQWLALLHLMKKHWNCDKIKLQTWEWECVSKRKELDRLYEYFANVHAGIEDLVKPQFYKHLRITPDKKEKWNVPLSDALISMTNASKLMFGPNSDGASNANHHKAGTSNQFNDIGVKMAFDWKDDGETSATGMKRLIQHKFDQYLNDFLQKWIKKALEKKAVLDALEEQIKKNEETAVEVQRQYDALKFDFDHHPVFGSPFFDITL